MKTLLIAIEGGEGTGKDTVVAYLKERAPELGDPLFVREPGGTAIGERLRDVLLDHRSTGMTAETELCTVFSARAQLLHEIVRPALNAGRVVISNRFALSSAVYQIVRKDREDIRALYDALYRHIVGDIPVHYIVLDCLADIGVARARARACEVSRQDMEDMAVHERIRNAYLKEVQQFPHTIIDATQTQEQVCNDVYEVCGRLLNRDK